MKIVTYPKNNTSNKTEYDVLRNLNFSPSADIISNRVSVEEVEVDIQTDDKIKVGRCAELWDDDDTKLWFYGRITYAEHIEDQIAHVIVTSELTFLDRKKMPAKMYSGMTAQAAIEECFAHTGAEVIIKSSAVSGKTITGFCKEQTKRERLQHILFVCGLYVQSSFVEHPTVTKMDAADATLIPARKTYWKPSLAYRQWVTAVNVTQYSFQQGTPQQGDESVTDGTTTWIVTKQVVSLSNNDAPSIAETNEVSVNDVMLVNQNNVSSILTSLATYYFKREEVTFDVVNNGMYKAGKKYTVYLNDTDMATGYAETLNFAFGAKSKSTVMIGACDVVVAKKLKITYVSVDDPTITLRKETYAFPEGYDYSITTAYIDMSYKGYQYVFRPTVDTVEGTMGNSDVNVTVNCKVALKLNLETRVLEIISVDEVNRVSKSEGGSNIYVAEIE